MTSQAVGETTTVEIVPTDTEQRQAFRKRIVEQYPIPTYSSAERTAILNDYLDREAQEISAEHASK